LALLASFRFPRRREDWLLGRWTAKQTLVSYLGLAGAASELATIEIRRSAGGAPEAFIGGRRGSVSISLSHRAGIGLCALAPICGPLGCDVELVEPRAESFVDTYFTAEERESILGAAQPERNGLIAFLWSAKESVLKALGVGLRRATTDIRVHAANGAADRTWQPFCAHTLEGGIFHGWRRETGALVRTIAVAAPGGGCLIQA
jgi:4'-phosphopantetheinyl transferase